MPRTNYSNHSSLAEQIVKKDTERDLFLQFLGSETEGQPISGYLYQMAHQTAVLAADSDPGIEKQELVDAITRRYKQTVTPSGLSAYDEMILDLIAAETSQHRLMGRIKQGKLALCDLPKNFPGLRKRAEILFQGKVAADLKPQDFVVYRTEKLYTSLLRDYAKDLFFAINHGLTKDATSFLRLIFELNRIKTSEALPSHGLRPLIAEKLINGTPLEIVHVKSLRFTYPEGNRLEILEDTAEKVQVGLPGEKRRYPQEEIIFTRISHLQDLFHQAGIATKVTVIVSDHDLDYCFPPEQNIVPPADVNFAKKAALNYVTNLRQLHPEVRIQSLTEFLTKNGLISEFFTTFSSLVTEAGRGGGKFIDQKILEIRVNQQFDHYQQMFGSYSRELARYTAERQIANLLSLAIVFQSFPTTPLLIIDSRGFENNLIGGYQPRSVVKFFTRLKDPTEITTTDSSAKV